MRKSTGTTLSWCARLAMTLLRCRPNTACKPDFNANLPHKNLTTCHPNAVCKSHHSTNPLHTSPTTTPTCRMKISPPQHSMQVLPCQPVVQEPHHDATHHSTTQKPHHQPTATPPCAPLLPLLTSYSSTIIAIYLIAIIYYYA